VEELFAPSMVTNTNGVPRSRPHRAVEAYPGMQRYSVVCFMRSSDDEVLRRLDGGNAIPPPREEGKKEKSTDSVTRRLIAIMENKGIINDHKHC